MVGTTRVSAQTPALTAAGTAPTGLVRETYNAKNKELPDGELGTLVRKEGDPPTGDSAIDGAHDNAKIVYDFYHDVLGRNSIDGKGMPLQSTAHFGRNFNNAYWDGSHMTYGDGDGKMFSPLSGALDVAAHEITHGVTERTANLDYEFQPGALNESWSDVLGEFVEQWHTDPKAFADPTKAKDLNWTIGESVFTPKEKGDALRSMSAPGTAYKPAAWNGYQGDPQPGNMKDYRDMSGDDDFGGVHVNSGIPNKAAYEVATRLGSEKTAKVWYTALTKYLQPKSTFSDAANATLSAARDLYGNDATELNAVRDGWKAVGLDASFVPAPKSVAATATATRHDGANVGVVPPWLTHPAARQATIGAMSIAPKPVVNTTVPALGTGPKPAVTPFVPKPVSNPAPKLAAPKLAPAKS